MNKRVVITGATRGIGRATAFKFATQGFDLVLSARDLASLNELRAQIDLMAKVKVQIVASDLSESNGVKKLIEEAGRFDVLVNNAGRGDFGPFLEQDMADFRKTIELNCMALVELTLAAAKQFKNQKGGTIINVASVAGFLPSPYFAVYSATKTFVISFSQALASELRPHNVKVCALCPGGVDTNFSTEAGIPDKILHEQKRHLSTSEEIAEAIWQGYRNPRPVVVVGGVNKVLVGLANILPGRAVANLVGGFYQKYVGPTDQRTPQANN